MDSTWPAYTRPPARVSVPERAAVSIARVPGDFADQNSIATRTLTSQQHASLLHMVLVQQDAMRYLKSSAP